jgi:uncharacterized surface protein with fasciclin (FAS1) repeats
MTTNTSQFTIAENARSAKSLRTCARLLSLAGLEEMLATEDRYTLFAPTDAAFAALPPGQLESLEKDATLLRGTLEYHILAVGRELSQLQNGKLPTLQGALLTASVTDDGVQLDHANTSGSPVRCANGVIHPIDAVLFPGFTPELSAAAKEESAWSGRRREMRITSTPAQNADSYFDVPPKTS